MKDLDFVRVGAAVRHTTEDRWGRWRLTKGLCQVCGYWSRTADRTDTHTGQGIVPTPAPPVPVVKRVPQGHVTFESDSTVTL